MKEGTKITVEVISQGALSVDIRGKGGDIIETLVTVMNEDERVEDLILESAKMFMKWKMRDKLSQMPEGDKLTDLLKSMLGDIIDKEEEPEKKSEKPYDFSGVEDLLTPEERNRL